MFKSIVLSVFITTCISLSVGFTLRHFTGFAEGAVGAFVLQFIAFYIFNTIKQAKTVEKVEDTSALEEIIALQTATVSCPCGQYSFYTPIFLNTDNIFTCEKCKSKFKVELAFDSILITEPLNLEKAYNFLKSKELP